jgi:hypothetical protein
LGKIYSAQFGRGLNSVRNESLSGNRVGTEKINNWNFGGSDPGESDKTRFAEFKGKIKSMFS